VSDRLKAGARAWVTIEGAALANAASLEEEDDNELAARDPGRAAWTTGVVRPKKDGPATLRRIGRDRICIVESFRREEETGRAGEWLVSEASRGR